MGAGWCRELATRGGTGFRCQAADSPAAICRLICRTLTDTVLHSTMRDSEVVAAIVAGDPDGLAEAYDRYASPLYAYCRSLLRESSPMGRTAPCPRRRRPEWPLTEAWTSWPC